MIVRGCKIAEEKTPTKTKNIFMQSGFNIQTHDSLHYAKNALFENSL